MCHNEQCFAPHVIIFQQNSVYEFIADMELHEYTACSYYCNLKTFLLKKIQKNLENMNNFLSEYIYNFKVFVIYILNCNEKSEKKLYENSDT